MKTRDLAVFVAVIETGSVQAAGERVGLTQSAVTRLIKRLEEELQVTLFDRGSRPLAATAEGARAYEHAKRILGALDDMSEAFAAGGPPTGPCRIGISHALISGLLRLPGFADLSGYPGLKPSFRADWSPTLIQAVQEGRLEGAFAVLSAAQPDPAGVHLQRLASAPLQVLGPRDKKEPKSLVAANAKGWVLNPEGCGYRRALETALGSLGEKPNIVVEANSMDLQATLAAQGIAYALSPAFPGLNAPGGDLEAFRLAGLDADLALVVVSPEGANRFGPVMYDLAMRYSKNS